MAAASWLREAGLRLMTLVVEEEAECLVGHVISRMKSAVVIAGATRLATAWWMDRRCQSTGSACAAKLVANSAGELSIISAPSFFACVESAYHSPAPAFLVFS